MGITWPGYLARVAPLVRNTPQLALRFNTHFMAYSCVLREIFLLARLAVGDIYLGYNIRSIIGAKGSWSCNCEPTGLQGFFYSEKKIIWWGIANVMGTGTLLIFRPCFYFWIHLGGMGSGLWVVIGVSDNKGFGKFRGRYYRYVTA